MWRIAALALFVLSLFGAGAQAAGVEPADPQIVKVQQALKKHGADITADGRLAAWAMARAPRS